ncbi:hypothetical protein GCM10011613_30280 [Cellvibrio zantedeschiae]|uniref:AAA+ ATPase domain-containing protein n=1 Tax=Cellvibrio zantedeschiae TaxID=1237077 RepID=A0ABQ3BAQ4_9GAMM|nr:ATP-binding protein [Cellvibrio zantedeschiae]GGY83338.1 hypothetical protein GCM10011613_30280 [Cellvibrio zantedeschiae]
MDDKTLQSLQAVFTANPTPELAQIIALQLSARGDYETATTYLTHLTNTISGEDGTRLGEAALKAGAYTSALQFLNQDELDHALLIVRCKLELGDLDSAQASYKQLLQEHPHCESAELNRRLKLSADKEPVKLRVIEKAEPAESFELLQFKRPTTNFSDVVGLEEVKKQIHKKIILPFQKPSLFQRFKKKVGGGILLYGPPGCGKTLLARATAGECKAAFFNIEISDVLDMYIGESEQKLRAIFEKARSQTPSVIFFDELEALAGKREHTRNSSQANTVSQFLTELDGFAQNNEGVLILGSTNVPWALDSAFLRPGRFDRMFFVPPPDKVARKAILEHHMQDRPNAGDIQFDVIANKTSGYSGADLANLVEMAADEAIDSTITIGEETAISMQHFSEALSDSRSSTTEWLTTARNYARYANDGGRYDDVLEFINKHGK